MSILDSNPSTLTLLQNNGFQIKIYRKPNINFNVQKVNIPGISLPGISQGTPFTNIIHPGDVINWDDFIIEFKVQEDMSDWLEMFEWIIGNGFPSSYDEYQKLSQTRLFEGVNIKSDIAVFILDAMKNPKLTITYEDAFPYALGGFTLESNTGDVNYVSAQCVFKYTKYRIEKVK